MGRVFIPQTGVEVVEGIPGSGKSYFLVRETIRLALECGRPVYTNLPLVWPVMRKYLAVRGGDPHFANLIQELTEEHFRAFCVRQSQRAEFLAEHRRLRRSGVRGLKRDDVDAAWLDRAGPDVIVSTFDREGTLLDPAPNWIPGGAVIIIDEVQEWFPQQRQKDDDLVLQGYLTKHRHHQHLVMVASQDRMQVAISFRRQCSKFWIVRNMSEDRLFFGVRVKHLFLRAQCYTAYTGEQVNAKSSDNVTPVALYSVITSFPWNQVIFKLYRSFTHRGSASKLRRDLLRARVDAGLLPVEKKEEKGVRAYTRRAVSWVLRFFLRWTLRVAVLGLVGLLCYSAGRGKKAEEVPVVEVVEKPKPVEPIKWGDLLSVGDGWLRLRSGRFEEGRRLPNGAYVLAAGRRERAVLLEFDRVLYAWKLGESAPRRLGERDQVAQALHAARVERFGLDPGESVPASP